MKVYYNGQILTMEDDTPQAEILIEEAGKIAYVGPKDGVVINDDAEWIDLAGHTLMPAFIDGHGHFSNTAVFLKTANLLSAESFDDIVQILKDYDAAHANDNLTAIIGMGYDHNFLKEGDHPTRYVLDKVRDDIPIMILHTSRNGKYYKTHTSDFWRCNCPRRKWRTTRLTRRNGYACSASSCRKCFRRRQ